MGHWIRVIGTGVIAWLSATGEVPAQDIRSLTLGESIEQALAHHGLLQRTEAHEAAAGQVLTVHRGSEGPVQPGEPLVEVGETEMLKVQVDVLSQDALRMRPGTPVLLEQWGGPDTLRATVERVDPDGHTDISALGVEEQRVTVHARLDTRPHGDLRLGSGFRVLARFIVWEGSDVLQVPPSALFRTTDGWAVFTIENGRAQRTPVEVGERSGLQAEVRDGLTEGQTVIAHPGNEVEDGVRVQARE